MKPQTLLTVVPLAGIILLAGCTQPDDEGPGPGVNGSDEPNGPDAVTISGFAFQPETLEVALGTTIIWTNDDDVAHTATADDQSWDAGTLQPGQADGHSFNDEGEFPYHCEFHPDMTGTVIVTR